MILAVALLSCKKEVEDKGPAPSPNPYTKVIFQFTANVDGADLALDTVKYENASSNIYGVNNLQFLIGKFRLDSWNSNEPIYINEYHLVDLNDPSTFTYQAKDTILIDDYQNITLFMGFDEKHNITGNYPDLDNKGWGWSPKYGGGYYTLRMYGTYLSTPTSGTRIPYNLAIGGKIRQETQVDTTYVPNPIYASMVKSAGFEIPKGTKVVKIEIRMDINKLFKTANEIPNFNFDLHQSNLEEDADGSAALSDNLRTAFRLGSVTLDDAATAMP
jgi:hypothetical protein